MKKIVLKLNLHGEKQKTKAMKIASSFEGVDSLSIDNDMKLTVIGYADAVKLALKMRKLCCVDLVSVGPANEERKKEEEHHQMPPHYSYYQIRSDRIQEDNPNTCIVL